jgi:hypothetical protein
MLIYQQAARSFWAAIMCEEFSEINFILGMRQTFRKTAKLAVFSYSAGEKGCAPDRKHAHFQNSRRTRFFHSDRWPLLTMTRVKAPWAAWLYKHCFSISALYF